MSPTLDAENLSPRLCFVGPMVARHKGHVTTQGEILSGLFSEADYSVIAVSHARNRYARLADIVRSLVRRGSQIDIQCLQVFGGPSFVVEDIASFIGKLFGQRVIMFLRGGSMPEFMARYPRWSKRVLARADAIVAPSRYLARAVSEYGFKAEVIPNVVNTSRYPFRRRQHLRPNLLWMRTFHEIWNPMMAVRVLARLRETVPDATLVMAGQDKGLEAQVRELAISKGLQSAVRFVGFVDLPQKVSLGNECDIFINTNHVDNMPVAVVEACAMGMPVVATDVGGIKDLLTDGETASLVPDDDDEAMVDALKRLLNEPLLAEQFSGNGRELAERSSWESVQPQLERIFARVSNKGFQKRVPNL